MCNARTKLRMKYQKCQKAADKKKCVLTRYVKFFKELRHSASHEIQVLSRYLDRDLQSVTGRNLRLIQDLTQLDPWTSSCFKVKQALISEEMVEVPISDQSRLQYLCSLLVQRRDAKHAAMESDEQRLEELIFSLVKN